jgi:hypothetical protein
VDRYNTDLKYPPNRDLDRSCWSVLAGFGYVFTDRVSGRLNCVHDKYSSKSFNAGKTANIYLASVFMLDNRPISRWRQHIDLPAGDD